MRDVMPLVAKGMTKLGNKKDYVPMHVEKEKILITELWKLKRSCHMNAWYRDVLPLTWWVQDSFVTLCSLYQGQSQNPEKMIELNEA